VVRQVRDPGTGQVRRDGTLRIGTVTILVAGALAPSGRFEPSGAGGEAPKVGDTAVRL